MRTRGRWRRAIAALGLAALALSGGSAREAAGGAHFAPTPDGPVYAGIPGALPPSFHYVYADRYRGWPVRLQSSQHPIRGSFLDPRGADDDGLSGYHFGSDINVDDARPDAGAPAGLSHWVYALESGVVTEPVGNRRSSCLNRRLDVGHFSYWHVSPIVGTRQRVRAGQQIGWTCHGVWHMHLSEWQLFQGVRVWVNPLHRGGPLLPYTDTAPPVVDALKFVTPPARPWLPTHSLAQPDSSSPLRPDTLHGLVEMRAHIGDPQSFLGFLDQNPAWPTGFTPYRVAVEIRSERHGRTVMKRVTFQADQLPQTPYLAHYAPGTIEADNMQECVGPPPLPTCAGSYWFRPFSRFRQEFWDTRRVPNGAYRVTVRAWDIAGNTGWKSVTAGVKN